MVRDVARRLRRNVIGDSERGAEEGLLATNLVADFAGYIVGAVFALADEQKDEERRNGHEQRQGANDDELESHGAGAEGKLRCGLQIR